MILLFSQTPGLKRRSAYEDFEVSMSTRIPFRRPLLHLTNGKLHVRRKLNFCATAKPIEFQYASKTLKGPTLGQSPVESCTQSLVEKGYECQTDDLREIGTIDETCFVEAKVSRLAARNAAEILYIVLHDAKQKNKDFSAYTQERCKERL